MGTGQHGDSAGSHPLGALGISDLAGQLYRLLLEMPGMSLSEAARRVGTNTGRTRDALYELESKGLATLSAGRQASYQPTSPELALGILIRQREQDLDRIRAAVADYQATFVNATSAGSPEHLVEVVLGRQAVVQRVTHLQRAAEREILVFDTPPYVAEHRQVTDAEVAHLRRGVRARVIYDRTALEVPGQLVALRQMAEAGEEARLLDHVPTKMMIADRRYAIVPLGREGPGVDGLVLVNAPPLVDALTALFESLWRMATPVALGPKRSGDAGALAREVDTDLLTLLAAGLKDDAIAHQLGVSQSTVQRRLRRTMDALGARSRVQVVLQAARRGLLPDSTDRAG